MNITELIKYDKLKEENEELKKELSEKNKEIKKLKSKHLFKEDFYLLCEEDELTYDWESLQTDEITIEMHLKYCESNNHRYCLIKDISNLPSILESKEYKISWR